MGDLSRLDLVHLITQVNSEGSSAVLYATDVNSSCVWWMGIRPLGLGPVMLSCERVVVVVR